MAEPTLTVRQESVLKLAASGLSTLEIATELGVAPRTAKAHLDTLRYKFRVQHKRELILAAQSYFGPNGAA